MKEAHLGQGKKAQRAKAQRYLIHSPKSLGVSAPRTLGQGELSRRVPGCWNWSITAVILECCLNVGLGFVWGSFGLKG